MTALAQDRDTKQVDGVNFEYPQAAVKIYDGAIVAMNSSGYATKGAVSATLKALGVAAAYSDNSGGSAGDLKVKVKKGVFRFGNSASSDAITLAEVGGNCYIVDDQTVAKTDGSAARSVAGVVMDVDSVGVWVKFA